MSDELKESEPNPYEPPRTAPEPEGTPRIAQPQTVSTTTIVLVSIALVFGVISIFPLVGIFFLLAAIPVYVRFARQEGTNTAARAVVRIATNSGIALSVGAAALGAFYGTCYASGFLLVVSTFNGPNPIIQYLVPIPFLLGFVAAVWTSIKLWPLTANYESTNHSDGFPKTSDAAGIDPPEKNGFAEPPDENQA